MNIGMLCEASAWRAILHLRDLIEKSEDGKQFFVRRDRDECSSVILEVERDQEVKWNAPQGYSDEAKQLFDLYVPMMMSSLRQRPYVIAHLGQSLDGHIATSNGSSQWISGHLDRIHNHRMRALCDAVLVGAETVVCDDPLLTCRTVEGRQPIRVVLDPNRRLPPHHQLFTDASTPTFILTRTRKSTSLPMHVSLLAIEEVDGTFAPSKILDVLWKQGIRRIFIEGGGATVSEFLRAQMVDRLQLTIAPVIIGSGRVGLKLPPIDSLDAALRPPTRRFLLGEDTMIECVFHGE